MSSEFEFKDEQNQPTHADRDASCERLTPGTLKRSSGMIVVSKTAAHGLETENTQLRLERTKTLLLASRVENALRDQLPSSNEEFRQTFDALINKLLQTEEALHAAQLERAAKIRTVEKSLRNECSRRLEVLRENYESELATRTQAIEQRLNAQFAAKLAKAEAAWETETDVKLTQSTLAGQSSLLCAQSNWEKRTRMTVRKIAWVWRSRERKRLAKAKREWRLKHREAIRICNQRWENKIARLERKSTNPTAPFLAWWSHRLLAPLRMTKTFRVVGLQFRIPTIRK